MSHDRRPGRIEWLELLRGGASIRLVVRRHRRGARGSGGLHRRERPMQLTSYARRRHGRCAVLVMLTMAASLAGGSNHVRATEQAHGGATLASDSSATLATVGDVPVLAVEVERWWHEHDPASYQRLRREDYEARRRAVDGIISERLLDAEARRRNVSIEELPVEGDRAADEAGQRRGGRRLHRQQSNAARYTRRRRCAARRRSPSPAGRAGGAGGIPCFTSGDPGRQGQRVPRAADDRRVPRHPQSGQGAGVSAGGDHPVLGFRMPVLPEDRTCTAAAACAFPH